MEVTCPRSHWNSIHASTAHALNGSIYLSFLFFFSDSASFLNKWRELPGGSVEKNLPAMQKQPQETGVRSLSGEDPLEEEMAAYSSVLAWRVPWMEESSGLQSLGSQRGRHNWSDSARMYTQMGISGLSRNFPPTRVWKPALSSWARKVSRPPEGQARGWTASVCSKVKSNSL